jgi:hypothetical protein
MNVDDASEATLSSYFGISKNLSSATVPAATKPRVGSRLFCFSAVEFMPPPALLSLIHPSIHLPPFSLHSFE